MAKDVEQQDWIRRWFAGELARLRLKAGRPTYKELERLSKKNPELRPLPSSTINDALNARYKNVPDWDWVRSLITACRIHAEMTDTNIDQLADVGEWHRRWYIAARSSLDTAPWPVTGAALTDSAEGPGRGAVARRPADGTSRGTGVDTGDRDQEGGDEPVARAAMLALARHAETLGWWREFGDVVPDWFRPYLSLEPAADVIRTYESRFVPDLLQTEEYARFTLHADADVDRRLELRMRRQRILHRPEPTKLWAIVDEHTLRRTDVPATIARAQLRHLVQISEQPNVTLQVVPAGKATASGPITVLRFPERELPDLVYLEQLTGKLYPDRPDDIHHYRQVLDRLGIEAEKGDATTAILHRIINEI